MEQNFQTSFIPKKPIIKERPVSSRPIGFSMVVTIFILFAVLLTAGALYLYKANTAKKLEQMKNDLNLAQNRFEPSKITQLQVLDRRLKASSEILAGHIAISPIFKALQDITMKSVRYTNFSYDVGIEKNAPVLVKMSGMAVGYRSVALQSDLYAGNKNFIDPVFSNLSLDSDGNVIFNLEFSVDRSFVDYKNTILTESEDTINIPIPLPSEERDLES
jgi:hypothetical protein